PEFDRSSGDLRVMEMLGLLARRHPVSLHVLHQPAGYLEAPANRAYAERLAAMGVRTTAGSLVRQLRRERYDVIVVEFWYVAGPVLQCLRALQPQARVLVDTEHVYFYADQVRQAAVGSSDSAAQRAARKRSELAVYAQADGILTTTDEDRDVVLAEDPGIRSRTVPNIHELPDAPVGLRQGRRPGSMVFVGNFRNNPSNADAMQWFCAQVLPRVQQRAPGATLRIVGNQPPPEVQALASAHVEVTGYVPETAPYLDTSLVSVCPLRYGAGLKGKIGEAMMRGLPVVTTTVGTQGMAPRQGQEILVADDPEAYAAHIARLFDDAALWQRMSQAGRDFIERHFGFAAIEQRLDAAFGDLAWLPHKRLPTAQRGVLALRATARDWLEQHVLWRWQG
ncbi:MAG: glycosyltransferase, partial [Burkholderiales bacterium]|nr:glycosyltransferase [Burkholderiales bacterium]